MKFLTRITTLAALLLLPACTIFEGGQAMPAQETSYFCADKSFVKASYPTTDTARIIIDGKTINMRIARSASGARYVGGGWQWWTKGMTEGTLAKLEPGESIASARGLACTAR